MFSRFSTIILLALVLTKAVAQQDDANSTQNTLLVHANLVVEPAIIRDKHGALVNGLGIDDFHLTADRIPQTIRYLDHDTDVPLTVGLLVDISSSVDDVLGAEKKASSDFLESNLAPASGERLSDKAFIMQFSHVASLLQDVTNSRQALASGINEIGTHKHPGGTALYDALYLASTKVMSQQSDRRAIILLTDGIDNGSAETLEDSIEAAQRSHIVVYAMYYQGQQAHWPYQKDQVDQVDQVDGKKILERVTSETGGRTFEIKSKQVISGVYSQIAEELRSQYRIGFTPSDSVSQIGYHHIRLQVASKSTKQKLEIQLPEGYYYGERSKLMPLPSRIRRR